MGGTGNSTQLLYKEVLKNTVSLKNGGHFRRFEKHHDTQLIKRVPVVPLMSLEILSNKISKTAINRCCANYISCTKSIIMPRWHTFIMPVPNIYSVTRTKEALRSWL